MQAWEEWTTVEILVKEWKTVEFEGKAVEILGKEVVTGWLEVEQRQGR